MSARQARTIYCVLLISFSVIVTNNGVKANATDNVEKAFSVVQDVRSSDREIESIGAARDDAAGVPIDVVGINQNEETEPPSMSSPTTTRSTSTTKSDLLYPWYRMTTARLILMLIVSFSIPVGFMALLFWRLRKEKKYMNARAGALVYTDTVLVPSYTVSDAENPNSNSNGIINVNHMYSTLYDTPPEYDAVVKSPTALEKSEKPTDVSDRQNITPEVACSEDTTPPPAYSSVYI